MPVCRCKPYQDFTVLLRLTLKVAVPLFVFFIHVKGKFLCSTLLSQFFTSIFVLSSSLLFMSLLCVCLCVCSCIRSSPVSFGNAMEGLEGACRFDAGAQHSALAKPSHISPALFGENEGVGVSARAKKALEVWCITSRHTNTQKGHTEQVKANE